MIHPPHQIFDFYWDLNFIDWCIFESWLELLAWFHFIEAMLFLCLLLNLESSLACFYLRKLTIRFWFFISSDKTQVNSKRSWAILKLEHSLFLLVYFVIYFCSNPLTSNSANSQGTQENLSPYYSSSSTTANLPNWLSHQE